MLHRIPGHNLTLRFLPLRFLNALTHNAKKTVFALTSQVISHASSHCLAFKVPLLLSGQDFRADGELRVRSSEQ